jgi:L-ascorbate metabolism protein UlaG (beta-lactamase superfamily)
MEIKWIGNTGFIIKTSTGKKILLDPTQIHPLIEKYELYPDIITFSHIHNNEIITNFVYKDYTIISSPCSFSNNFISIEGFKTFRDNLNGYKRGENIIYYINVDEYKICHLGSIGHILNSDLLSKVYGCDFLFIPIGGHFYLNGCEASKLAKAINPKYIIPMAYKTSSDYFYLNGPRKFLYSMKNASLLEKDIIYTDDLSYDENCTVIILSESNSL